MVVHIVKVVGVGDRPTPSLLNSTVTLSDRLGEAMTEI